MVVTNTGDVIWLFDLATNRFSYASPSVQRLCGFTPEEMLTKSLEDTLAPESYQRISRLLAEAIAAMAAGDRSARVRTTEAGVMRKDGSTMTTETVTNLLTDEQGRPTQILGVSRDITERIKAGEALRESEERFRSLYASMVELVVLHDVVFDAAGQAMDYRILDCNPAFTQITGISRDRAVGTLASDLYGTGTPPYLDAFARVAITSEPAHFETYFPPMGKHFEISVFSPRPGRFATVASDITARKQAEVGLRESREQLQYLSSRLIEVQEEERSRLARELHDGVGQVLTATKIKLQGLQRLPDPQTLGRRLDEAVGLMDRTIEEVRSISVNLRPPMLDDLGLVAGLRWLLDQQARNAGLQFHFSASEAQERLNPAVETACFRVAQEALTNIVRHARASRVWMELRRGQNDLQLSVRDDGAGFDPAQARQRAAVGRGLGLLGMKERAGLLAGNFEVLSKRGGGTEVRVWFPLQRKGAEVAHDSNDTTASQPARPEPATSGTPAAPTLRAP